MVHPGGVLAELDGRDDDVGRRSRHERDATERDGTDAGHRRVVIEVREERDGVVDRHGRGDAASGDTDGIAHEEHAVAAGDVVEIDGTVRIRRTADG